MDVLRAQQDLAGTSGQRAAIALKMLALDKEMQDADTANRVRRAERDFAEGKITADALAEAKTQAEKLKASSDQAYALKQQAILRERELDQMERADKLTQRSYEVQLDDLQFRDEMADTQAEHRRIQLEIVDVAYKQKEAALRDLKARLLLAGKLEEAADVQADIDRLPQERDRDRERATRGTRGPLEDLASQLPLEADKLNEALEGVAANGLKSLEDGLLDVIQGTKSVKEAFHDMAQQILAELLRIAIQKYIIGTILKAVGVAGAADGGQVGSFAYGGFVSGPGGPRSDSVPAMLSNGEFVINAKSTKKFLPLLEAMNSGKLSRLAMGGLAIPRAQFGERARFSNDNAGMSPISMTFHNDFRGADPSSVAAIKARQDRMEAELPVRVIAAYRNAKDRFVIRD